MATAGYCPGSMYHAVQQAMRAQLEHASMPGAAQARPATGVIRPFSPLTCCQEALHAALEGCQVCISRACQLVGVLVGDKHGAQRQRRAAWDDEVHHKAEGPGALPAGAAAAANGKDHPKAERPGALQGQQATVGVACCCWPDVQLARRPLLAPPWPAAAQLQLGHGWHAAADRPTPDGAQVARNVHSRAVGDCQLY